MGCGTSKSAGVVSSEITIKNHPGRISSFRSLPILRMGGLESSRPFFPRFGFSNPRSHHEAGVSSLAAVASAEGVTPQASDESRIERAMQEVLARSPGSPQHSPPVGSTAVEERVHEQACVSKSTPSKESLPPSVAFEVCMSPEGTTAPRAPPPRRLTKLDSAPKLTTEMLEEKQREARERKKELQKRAHTRLSRRERLRREIMEAKEMELPDQEQSANWTKSAEDAADTRVRGKAHRMGLGEEESASFTASADMEVDSTFNAEQHTGFWDSNQSSENSLPRTHRPSSEEDFFSDHGAKTNLLESSSQNMEQYM